MQGIFNAALLAAMTLLAGVVAGPALLAAEGMPPAVGEKAPDFTLSAIGGEAVKLTDLVKRGPVVLVVLRGWPGYQCPICNTQVGRFLGSQQQFKAADASVVFVYPGPADGLKGYAEEFTRGRTFPDNFHFVIDPDYEFTNKYRLRWDAKSETAYPSTFVIEKQGVIRFAKISKTHGGRASAEEVVKALSSQ
jgi:peroxiredoxin